MKLFVSESVCGGGWQGGERPLSLIREGLAMLRAFVDDAVLAGCQVTTTWDQRLGVPASLARTGVQIIPVDDPHQEAECFTTQCRQADAVCIIAPELNHELLRRVQHARMLNPQLWNCSEAAIELCGDKWAFFQHCQPHQLPTIPTYLADDVASIELAWPRVLKLRLGAGSQSMQLVAAPTTWEQSLRSYDAMRIDSAAIAQPFLRGAAVSMGVIVDGEGRHELLPTADQFIDPSQGFAYSGGRLPSTWNTPAVRDLADRVVRSIPGLRGYVGIDLLIPEQDPESPLVVEVNPRLTTSYIGYRQLCQQNLVSRLMGTWTDFLQWKQETVTFSSEGLIQ